MQACAGINVLEIGGAFGVPALCGQLFAGLGASVKVAALPDDISAGAFSPAAADYLSRLLHAGKERLTFSSVVDRAAALRDLIDWADVVICNRTDADMAPVLVDASAFEAEWPRKILCQVSLCGAKSSRPDWIGNELIAEAAGALMMCNGYPDRPPVTSGLPYAIHTAALFAFNAIMTALWDRDISKKGQSIDLAVVDCIAAVLGNFLPSYFISGKSPKRIGNRHTIAAPWNIYPASDGDVVICTGTGGTGWWARVTAVIDRPELTNDPRYATEADRVRNVDEVDAIMAEWTSVRTMQDIVDRMTVKGIPVGEIGTVEALLADPHYRDLRAMVLPSDDGLPRMGIPLKIGAWHADAPVIAAAAEARDLRGKGDRSASGPLAGIRILEFASRTSVPLAGRLMTDLGADVVKIEPLKGDALRGAGQQIGGASYLFHINNAGKRSVVIDPNSPEGRDLILDLVQHADVFVENLAPGSVEKMGLGYAEMKRINPDLIYCSVSGFGARSNYGSKRALDTVVQASCGLMYMTGYADHYPVKLGISAVDLTTATATMASILGGLRQRLATGQGLMIDLAMADVGMWMTQSAWPQMLCDSVHPIRAGNRNPHAAPHDIFPAGDGRFVAIAVETDAQWRALVDLVGAKGLVSPERDDVAGRLRDADAIGEVLGQWTAGRTADEIAASCQAHGIPASPVRDLVELVADPDVSDREMVIRIEHPAAGDIRLLGNPAALSRTPPVVTSGAPALGEQTADILADWLSLSRGQLETLARDGVIASADLPKPSTTTGALVVAASES